MKPIDLPPRFDGYQGILEELKESGSEPMLHMLLKRLGVQNPTYYYESVKLEKPWAILVKKDFDAAAEHWKKHGGSAYKTLNDALKDTIKKGIKPTEAGVSRRAGFVEHYLRFSLYSWKVKFSKQLDNAISKWEKHGGIEAKKIRASLKAIQKRGEEPAVIAVCRDAGFAKHVLYTKAYEWQANLLAEIGQAQEKYDLGEYNAAYEKCLKTLEELLVDGEFPLPASVAVKAGFSSMYFNYDLKEWKEKVLAAIKDATKDYTKVKPLFLDSKALRGRIESGSAIDYRRIGILLNVDGMEYKHHLSHTMYQKHVFKAASRQQGVSDLYVDGYDESRRAYVDGIIMATEGVPEKTILQHIPYMAKAAVWMGDNTPSNAHEAKQAFKKQAYMLDRAIKEGKMAHGGAQAYQQGLLKLLSGMLGEDASVFSEDNTNLFFSKASPASNAYSNTAKFTQKELEYAFSFYYHFFDQVADILLNEKAFPYPIKLPDPNTDSRTAILTGLEKPMMVDVNVDKYGYISRVDGHILGDKEIEALVQPKSKTLLSDVRTTRRNLLNGRQKALRYLEAVNHDMSHERRLQLGKKALDAWFMCMFFFTGMNDSTQGTLEWGDDDEFDELALENKEFANIKPRALYKEVRFALPKAAMKDFRRFLELRRFVLGGKKMAYLFFMNGYGELSSVSKVQLEGGMGVTIAQVMRKAFDPDLPQVTSRSARKDMARDALKQEGLEVALAVLQNTSDTFLGNYNGQTAEEMAGDVAGFMASMHDGIISGMPPPKDEELGIGACRVKRNGESATIEGSPVEANCKDLKSCLFCEHFKTFPEPEYIRKLLSLKYIIENISYDRAPSDDFFEKAMGPWLVRIETIFDAMKEKEPKAGEWVEEIEADVNAGALSPYWMLWSETYEEIGRF